MGSHVVTPGDVVESLMSDGTFDAIRLKIINQLKANEELKNNTMAMVEQSRVLNLPGAEKKTKRELFDALRQELEMPVLEKAAKAVWEMILDDNGLGKEITENVERVYCQLNGHHVPPLTASATQQPQKVKENKEGGQKVKEIMSKSSGKKALHQTSMQRGEVVTKGFKEIMSKSSSRKKALDQARMQSGVVTKGVCNHPAVVSDDVLSSSNSNA